MKNLIGLQMYLVLAFLSIALVGCSPPDVDSPGSGSSGGGNSETGSSSTGIVRTSEPMEAEVMVEEESAEDLSTVVGFSFPKNNGESFSHDIATDLTVKFWVVATSVSEVSLTVNGIEYDLSDDDRPDVERLYPSHLFRKGFIAVVSADSIQSADNDFTIRVDGEVHLNLVLSIQ